MLDGNDRRAGAAVFLCFFLSGAAGLAYEVLWIRQLSLIFGTTAFAVSTVLTAFMGGLALGSFLFGRIADRLRNPLRLYAGLELVVGVYCLLVPFLLQGVTQTYVLTARSFGGSFYTMSLVRFLLCAAVLVLPTTFMGATLPILSRAVVRRVDRVGSGVGSLYGINTFGAVLGCFATGYLLIGSIGIWAATAAAAALNAAVAVIAFSLSRSVRAAEGSPEPEAGAGAARPTLPLLHAAVLVGIGLSGFASMTYEVAWTRLLTLVLGSSVYAFSAMLTTFLLGIAIGSVIVSRFADRLRDVLVAFLVTQIAIAVGVLAISPLFDRLPVLFLDLYSRMGSSFWTFELGQFLLCVLVMFLPTLFIGTTLPLVVKAFTERVDEVGRSVGAVYASNTVGGILGSFLAGFVLLPALGTQKSIAVAAGLNLLIGIGLYALLPRPRRALRALVAAGAALLFGLVAFRGHAWDRYMLNAGLFDNPAYALHQVAEKGFQEYVRSYDIRFYEEDPYATVAVSYEAENLFLQINGRTEASTTSDMSNQILVAQIPMLIHPDPKDVIVVGLGSGITLGSVLTHAVDRADCIEISPAVVRAAAYFRDWHADVTKNPKARIILDDARNYLLATEGRYDVIVAEPSKPWISGVSNLFTREAYEIYRARLKPGGLLCQWFHYYSMNPDDFRTTLRTFLDVFPYAQVWNADNNVFLLGSEEPIVIHTEVMAERMALPKVEADLRRVRRANPYLLLGHFLFSEKEAREYVGTGRLNVDNLPVIEFSAPRYRGASYHEEILNSMLTAFPRFQDYPIVGHIAEVGDTIDFRLANLRFASPIGWASGAAGMVRSVVSEGRLEEAEGPLVGYRLEATMVGSSGEQLRMAGITRGAFPEEKLRLTVERLAPGLVSSGAGSVSGHPAYWAVYRAERPAAALTWFHPRNKLQYVVQLAGAPGQSGEELREMLLQGASSEDFSGIVLDEPPAKTEEM
jgi:spermidine synthase